MEGYDDVKTWFRRELTEAESFADGPKGAVQRSLRTTGCVGCSIALQMFVSIVIIFLLKANLLSPLQWLKDGSLAVFSFTNFGYTIVLAAITTCLVLSYAAQFKMHPTVFSTVYERIVHFVSPWRLLSVAGYFVAGGLVAIVYLRIAGSPYSALSVSCEIDFLCVNRRHVLLISSACFVGLLYGIALINGANHSCVRFPIIQRKKYVQVKTAIWAKTCDSFRSVFSNLKWFLLSYAFIGFRIENYLTNFLGWNVGTSSFFGTLYGFIDVRLWWSVFVVDTAVHLLFSSVAYFFAVFLTEKLSFPVESPFENQACRSLKNVFSCVDCPLLRHLTFLDLSLSAEQSASKRKDIFSLSQPGGHPRHWNTILDSCLRLVRDMTDQIMIFCEQPAKLLKSKTQGEAYSTHSSTDVAYEMWRSQRFSHLYSSNHSAVSPEMLQSAYQESVCVASPSLAPPFDIITPSKIFLRQKLDDLWKYVNNIPLVAYFIRESVETSVNKIFASCQLHIWAIEALSFLVVASFEEDKYGVVQKDLSTILVCLLDLQQALNKLHKFELALGPTKKTTDSWPDQLKASLKFTVKSALYRIVTTFGSHLNAISLSNEHRRHLNQYLAFQE